MKYFSKFTVESSTSSEVIVKLDDVMPEMTFIFESLTSIPSPQVNHFSSDN